MKYPITVGVVCVALVIGLAACSSSVTEPTPSPVTSSASSTPLRSTPAPPSHSAAVLNLRGLVAPAAEVTCTLMVSSGAPATASPSQKAVPCSSTTLTQVAQLGKFTIPLSGTDYNKLSSANQQLITAALAAFDCSSAQTEKDIPASYYVACDKQGLAYLLGPVVVAGKQIADASVHAPDSADGVYRVALDLTPSGQSKLASYTSAHNVNGGTPSGASTTCSTSTTPCADYVGSRWTVR